MSETGQKFLETIMSSAHSAASRLRVKSALNPMLWLCGIITPISFLSAFLFRQSSTLTDAFTFIGLCPVLATIVGFFYFMIRSPEKLQSEDYQLRHETLELIKQKGTTLAIEPSSLTAIANPAVYRIEGSR